MKGRIRRQQIFEILGKSDFDLRLAELRCMPSRKVVNALFSFLYHQHEIIKWRAVTAMGIVVQDLAHENLERARVILRRLMWNLNDESGGIGWGSPEAMGEILARHEGLAGEYAPILLSYANKDGNYLELPMLQRGLLWGIARLSEERPGLVLGSISHLLFYLQSKDPVIRGHAAEIMGLLGAKEARKLLLSLIKDRSAYATYSNHHCMTRLVGETAEEALEMMEKTKKE